MGKAEGMRYKCGCLFEESREAHTCTHGVPIFYDDICYFYFPSGMSCSKDKFSCADGRCVSWNLTCNGEKNCEDGTDEPSFCKIFLSTKLSDLSLCNKKQQQTKHTSVMSTQNLCDLSL